MKLSKLKDIFTPQKLKSDAIRENRLNSGGVFQLLDSRLPEKEQKN